MDRRPNSILLHIGVITLPQSGSLLNQIVCFASLCQLILAVKSLVSAVIMTVDRQTLFLLLNKAYGNSEETIVTILFEKLPSFFISTLKLTQ